MPVEGATVEDAAGAVVSFAGSSVGATVLSGAAVGSSTSPVIPVSRVSAMVNMFIHSMVAWLVLLWFSTPIPMPRMIPAMPGRVRVEPGNTVK